MNDTATHRWASPLSGASPSGVDVMYDPRFEKMSNEVDKLSSVSGGRPDWRAVEENGEALLTAASKDIRVGAWTILAKTHVHGWSGLADGIEGMTAMIGPHWETMHPPLKRMRARANALEQLWSQLPGVVQSLSNLESDAEVCDRIEGMLATLSKDLETRLLELNPSSREVQNVVRERQRNMPRPAPPSPAPSSVVEVEGSSAEASSGAPTPSSTVTASSTAVAATARPAFDASKFATPEQVDVATLDAAMDVARKWQEILFNLGRQARRSAPSSGWPYRITRMAAWITVESIPEIEEADRTYVRAPSAADQRALADMFAAGSWDALADASEESLSEHIFWLDTHRFSALALERLGHHEARASVGREASAFLRRFPSLLEMKFAGGTSFANPETRAWFEQESAVWGGATSSSSHRSDVVDLSAVLEAARVRMGSGDALGAIAQALKGAREQPSPRARFSARIQVADFALGAGEAAAAKAVAEELLDEIGSASSANSVDTWAPEEAGLCYQVYVRAERNLAASEERPTDDRLQSILKRLLQVDPESAMRLWRS